MPMLLSIELDDEVADALDQMIEELNPGCSRDLAAAAVLYDWLINAGYLPADEDGDTAPIGSA